MRWLKREMWKTAIALIGMLLLLVLMAWVPVSEAGAYEGVSGPATPVTGTVQATPTVDVTATMTALQEDKLRQEIQQIESQTQNQNNWLFSNSAALIAALSAISVAVFGILQWFGTARQAKDKDLKAQAEERFKTAVTALGDEKESVQVNGAILLRSFLRKEDEKIYGRYHTQIFDLAAAYLCLPRISSQSKDPGAIPHSPENPNASQPITPSRHELIVVFKEAFPLARNRLREQDPKSEFHPLSLDATSVKLDNAFLWGADLEQVWMPEASLREADLGSTHLSKAKLRGADLREARLDKADLSEANLSEADLSGVRNLEEAQSLKDTDLRGVKGLTKEQLEVCKAKGAIIDEDTTTSPPQSPVVPPPPSQSNDAQTPSAPSVRESTPTPDTGSSSATSSQPSSGA